MRKVPELSEDSIFANWFCCLSGRCRQLGCTRFECTVAGGMYRSFPRCVAMALWRQTRCYKTGSAAERLHYFFLLKRLEIGSEL